jgi:hypothetical protein
MDEEISKKLEEITTTLEEDKLLVAYKKWQTLKEQLQSQSNQGRGEERGKGRENKIRERDQSPPNRDEG